MNTNYCFTKDYEKLPLWRPKKTNPNKPNLGTPPPGLYGILFINWLNQNLSCLRPYGGRWDGCNFFCSTRQICWAHLKGDFQAISEVEDTIGKKVKELYSLVKKIPKLRKRVRDGTLQWRTFQSRMVPLLNRVEELLEQAAKGKCTLSGCRRLARPAVCRDEALSNTCVHAA
jgi:hypothetical protein